MQFVAYLLLFALLVEFTIAVQPSWTVNRPTVVEKDVVPAAGRLDSEPVNSFFECSFYCNQNPDCLMFAFNTTGCDLYKNVYPQPNPAHVKAPGYITYRGRNKIYKVVKKNLLYDDGNQECKNQFGGRLASPSDNQAFSAVVQIAEEQGKNSESCDNFLIGLRPNGTTGIFKFATGDTINVVNGTGFQRWIPNKPPSDYKTKSVNVAFICYPPFGYWIEIPDTLRRWALCEAP